MDYMIATKSFTARDVPGYAGETLSFVSGKSYVAADHAVVAAHRDCFAPAPGPFATRPPAKTPHTAPVRSRRPGRRSSRPKPTLNEELRIRAERIAELDRKAVLDRRSRASEDERRFWRSTAELLEAGTVDQRVAETLAEYDPELEAIEEAADEARRRAALAGESPEEFWERAAAVTQQAAADAIFPQHLREDEDQ